MRRATFLVAAAVALCAAAPPTWHAPPWRKGDLLTVRSDDAVACFRPETLGQFYGGDLHDPGPHDWQPEDPATIGCARPGAGRPWRFQVAVAYGDIVELHFNSAETATVWMRTRDVEYAGSANDYPGWWDGSTDAQ